MTTKYRHSRPLPPQGGVSPSRSNEVEPTGPPLRNLIDAVISYVVDPTQWEVLTGALELHDPETEQWEPEQFLSVLSRAEALSWQMKRSDPAHPQLIYVLLDDQDRATAQSDNVGRLGEYLQVSGRHDKLNLLAEASRLSYESAKARLTIDHSIHVLVELTSASNTHKRFGYLVDGEQFPSALREIGGSAVRALIIPHDEPSEHLKRVIQTSFGLTAAECSVAMTLARGLSLKETAQQLNISIHTARNHLQAVYDKSGIKRQSDLVLVVTQLSVVLAATTETAAPNPAFEIGGRPATRPQHFVMLPDGRRLAYRTYGDPAGSTVLYFHETIGSSLLPSATDDLARERRMYLIAMERPGFASSDPDPDYSFDSVCADSQFLLDHLRVSSVAILGHRTGAAYAMACAARLQQDVTRVLLVSGRPPLPLDGAFDVVMKLETKMLRQPWLLSTFFNILRNRTTNETMRSIVRRVYGTTAEDRAYMDSHPEVLDWLASCAMENLSVTANGIVNELQCFADPPDSANWVTPAPLILVHGEADTVASASTMQGFLGNAVTETVTVPNAGTLVLLERWTQILDLLKGR